MLSLCSVCKGCSYILCCHCVGREGQGGMGEGKSVVGINWSEIHECDTVSIQGHASLVQI